jgi:imidazolonepropionase-like amidohydrolase
VIPGLIDVHVHDASEEYRHDMLAWVARRARIPVTAVALS